MGLITRDGFSVVPVGSIDLLIEQGKIPENITHDNSQKSGDGVMMWIKGSYSESIKVFPSSVELYEYIYANGWKNPSQ